MNDFLEDIHYESWYFDKEIIDEENYNAFDDFLLNDGCLFNKELIIDVLDYLKDDDIWKKNF